MPAADRPATDPADDIFAGFDFRARGPLVVAVSGGSDSLALLEFARRRFGPGRLLTVTVDHGLRPESAAEARNVAERCARLGIAHRTMAWTEFKPLSGVSLAARVARYALIAEAAGDAGATIVLTGHTADDQAETVAMRSARGEGRGLAGIPPATLFGGTTWFVRPLLDMRRMVLQAGLAASGVAWVSDPSNDDPRSERARTRQALAGTDIAPLLAIAHAAASARAADGHAAARLIDSVASQPTPSRIVVDRALFADSNGPGALLAFRLLLSTAGGIPHLPDAERARILAERIAAGGAHRGTLARVLVDTRGETVALTREQRGKASPGAVDAAFASPFATLLPSFDMAPARALARLLGADAPPSPPFAGHNAGEA